MTQENLFATETPSQTQTSTNPDDLLDSIKNENGERKYKDIPTALNALQHSQNFIQSLKTEKSVELSERDAEIARLKLELEQRQKVEDIVKNLTNQQTTQTQTPSVDQPQVNVVDEQKVLSLVEQALQKQAQKSVAENNLNLVNKAIADKFGTKARDKIQEVAKKVNTTPDQLQNLARENPALVLSLFETVQPDKSLPTFTNTNELNTQQTQTKPKSVMKGGVTKNELVDVWKQHGAAALEKLGITT